LLAFTLAAILTSPGWSRTRDDLDAAIEASTSSISPSKLAAEVGNIAHSSALSRAKKEKRISNLTRVTVIAATAYKSAPDEILTIALEYASAASASAPAFAEVIANAVSFTPAVKALNSASGQVRTAAFASAKSGKLPARPAMVAHTATPPRVTASTLGTEPPAEVYAPRSGNLSAESSEDGSSKAAAASFESNAAGRSGGALQGSTSFHLTAEVGVRRDDNVYLNDLDKRSDTILSVTPGVEVHYGQNSVSHGTIVLKDSFVRYTQDSAPNVNLVDASADFAHDSGTLKLAADASYQQFSQNTAAGAVIGSNQVYQYNVLAVHTSAESELTAKTRVKVGAELNNLHYKTVGLIGSQDITIPLKVYYETTPKFDLFAGFDYRHIDPQDDGPSGRDLYYNLGFRGNLTPKLSGEFSTGYRSRQVGENDRENLWGFDGKFKYEMTAKSTMSLSATRDFGTGAQGQSLKNTRYAVTVGTELTTQWQLGAIVAYTDISYGPEVFTATGTPLGSGRNDKAWEATLQAGYAFTGSLNATANYVYRSNDSTIQGLQYTNNILSLMLGYRY